MSCHINNTNPLHHPPLLLISYITGAVLMLLLAPSTAAELATGELDIPQLNNWLNKAQEIEMKNLQPGAVRTSTGSAEYFEFISRKLEGYKVKLENAISNGQFDDDGKVNEEEKMGDDWNAIIADGENNDERKRERREEQEGHDKDRGFHDEDNMMVSDDFEGDSPIL